MSIDRQYSNAHMRETEDTERKENHKETHFMGDLRNAQAGGGLREKHTKGITEKQTGVWRIEKYTHFFCTK